MYTACTEGGQAYLVDQLDDKRGCVRADCLPADCLSSPCTAPHGVLGGVGNLDSEGEAGREQDGEGVESEHVGVSGVRFGLDVL